MAEISISCDCGATGLALSGPPIVRGICHCAPCRALYNAAFHAGAAWSSDSLTSIRGESSLRQFKYPGKELCRYWCVDCGAILFNTNRYGFIVVPMALLRKANDGRVPEDLTPLMHLFYASRVVDIDDPLPKFLEGTNGPLFRR